MLSGERSKGRAKRRAEQVPEVSRLYQVHFLQGERWRKARPVANLKEAAAQAQEFRREGKAAYIKGR